MNERARVTAGPSASASFASARSGVLQRKCACGGTPGPTGECAECRRERLPGGILQPKLQVGRPDDRFEREADRVADQVMRMPEPGLQRQVHGEEELLQPKPLVQSRVAGGEGGSPAPPIVHDMLRLPGQPLDRTTRAFFEPRFGHDFSRVRVYSGSRAAEAARSVNAKAFTVGQNVVFGAGYYPLAGHQGDRLLAHELAHVVQQSSGALGPAVQRDEETAGKTADPFKEVRKAVSEIQSNWADVKSAAASFKATEEWIKHGDTVVFLIGQHTTAAIDASKAGQSQLLEFYLRLLESDKVMYDYIAWHIVVHANILGMKSRLSSVADSFKADDREFTGRKEAEEHLRLLQKLADVFPKQSETELKQINVGVKVTAKSGAVILAETTATNALSDKAHFEKQTTDLIGLQSAIQTLAGELNQFLENATIEGLQQAGQALIEFIQARGSGKGKGPKVTKPKSGVTPGGGPKKPPAQQPAKPAPKKQPLAKKDQPDKKAQKKKPEERKKEQKKEEKKKEKKEEQKKTCASQFPAALNCSRLPFAFTFRSPQAALAALKISTGSKNLKLVTPAPSTGGPCPGVGMHYGVKEGGKYIASISCCPCCEDTPAGPRMVTRCRII